ncbi:MAG: AfsR/SARP family transcriptional regulator [Fimbriimonas sp.]
MHAPCRIEMFGGLRVRQGGRCVERFQTQKTGALLAYLALQRPRAVPREAMAELLWPEGAPDAVRNRLNQAVSSLRRQLHPPELAPLTVLVTDHHTLALSNEGVETDVEEFREALAAAERTSSRTDRLKHLRRAVELYAGELLAGYFEDWILPDRLGLGDRYAEALETLIREHSRAGEPETAIEFAQRRLALDPEDPRANVELMDLYLRADRPASALRHFDELVRTQDEVPAAARALVARAERQMRSAPPSLPKARRTAEPAAHPAAEVTLSLPRIGTRFFGREREVEEVRAALREGARVVTLLGIGGSGKTRLALEVAQGLTAPVAFVGLAGVSRAAELVAEVRRVVAPTASGDDADPTEALARAVGAGSLVLILDNLEHLEGDVSAEVRRLLDRVPGLQVLATSREPLGLHEEVQYTLGPLPVPTGDADLAALAENPSVALFVARAQAVRPDFGLTERTADAIRALCLRMEGMPLAIELAAGWARALTPAQILEQASAQADRLESRRKDIPARHRTMRTAIDGSVGLLTPAVRDAFVRFAVFAGGWDREAAAAMAPEADVDEALDALAARSMIRVEHGEVGARYAMLEVLRTYGRSQMSFDLAADVGWRHADFYLERAEATDDPAAWMDRVALDYPNFLAALEWLVAHSENGRALRLAAALAPFWEARGRVAEGRARLEALLGLEADRGARSAALAASGRMAWLRGDYAVAKGRFLEALDGFRAEGDRARELDVRFSLQMEAHRTGDYDGVRALLADNLALATELGDGRAVARCWLALGNASVEQLRWEEAGQEYARSLEAARACMDEDRIAQALNNLGNLALLQGKREAARRWLGEGLERFRRVGHQWHTAMALLALAKLDAAEGDPTAARARLREAMTLARDEDLVQWRVMLQAAFARVQEGEGEAAAQLFGFVERLTSRVGPGRHGVEMAPYGDHVARLRTLLPEARVDELWEFGRHLTADEAAGLF